MVYLGGPSAKYCVLVFKTTITASRRGPSAKVGSSAKYCVLVFKATIVASIQGN